MYIKHTAIGFCILCFVAQASAGDYGAAIDSQSRVMDQIMRDFSTVQSNNAAYWRAMPKRKRFILRTTNAAVKQYKREVGRYPTINDTDFFRYVFEKVGIQNNQEKKMVIHRIQSSSNTYKELDDLHSIICRGSKAHGFNYSDCP